MMQQHVRGARRVRARVVADDPVPAVHRLDRVALEPGVEIVAGGVSEEIEQLALHVEAEAAQPVGDAAGLDEFRDRRERMALDHVRRRFQRERAQHVGNGIEPRLIGVEPLGIARGKLRHFLVRLATTCLEVAPVIERQKVRDVPLNDAQALLGER
jgi:hypothetical protein